jgi:hypothetical protein
MAHELYVLDQPWQIELYRLLVLSNYCRFRAKNIPVANRRTLSSINKEFGFKARTFAEVVVELDELIASKRRVAGLDPETPR